MENLKIDELDAKLDKLNINVAQLTTKIDMQENSMTKMMEGLNKLTTYIERTNENDKKINTLFKKLDNINDNGTKNCPVNIQRIDTLNKKLAETNKRIDNLDRWLIGGLITLAFQFLFIIIHFLDKVHL